MIERAIENWLINTTERNYQAAFCQVLLQKGHKVIYFSSHRPMEQGKDIVTIDSSGDYCAYQLKTGDINITKWRSISGEIKELIELPIIHPSVDKNKLHKSFLVTNGRLTDEVRIQIDQINDDNQRKGRNYSYLDIISDNGLLKDFIDAQGDFIPKKLEDFHLFLKLFLADGTDFISKGKYFDFLNKAIFNIIPNRKSDVLNAISSSVVIVSYLLNSYQIKNNYYALFEAWTCLAACIVRYTHKAGLTRKDWEDSLRLISSEINRNLFLLKDETLRKRDFIEGTWLGDGGLIYRARATIVLGTLALLEVYLNKLEKKYVSDKQLLEIIKNNIRILWLWGESAFPYLFGIIKYLEINEKYEISQKLLHSLFKGIVDNNTPRKHTSLADPYYSITDIFESISNVDQEKIDYSNFSGSSYTLDTIISMLVRRNDREILEKNWKDVSYIQFKEFIPKNAEDIFLCHIEEGTNHSMFPNSTQSWSELKKEKDNSVKLYVEYFDILLFYVATCPHRVNKEIIRLLDNNF